MRILEFLLAFVTAVLPSTGEADAELSAGPESTSGVTRSEARGDTVFV